MKKFLSALAAVFLISACTMPAFAEEGSALGALDTSNTTSVSSSTSGSDLGGAIAEANKNIAPSEEDIKKASETVQPVVKIVNYGIGIVLGLLGTVLIGITILDIVYIVSPSAVRNIGGSGQPVGGGMMGQAQPAQATGFAAIISDDCKAALAESGAAAGNPVAPSPMGGGFGGGFGGGMGMGMGMGAPAPAAAPKAKNVIKLYMKKRVVTFVFIGVCMVVLTCTCFLDVGLKLGTWLVGITNGLAG